MTLLIIDLIVLGRYLYKSFIAMTVAWLFLYRVREVWVCKTIKQKVTIRLAPKVIYEILTDSKKHTALTGQRTKIAKVIGGKFETHAGKIWGINVDFKEAKRIVLAWRSFDFPEGIFSMATIDLSQTKKGDTYLVLTHRGVPKHLIAQTERAWRENYWKNMKKLKKTG